MDTISSANLSGQDPPVAHADCARALVVGEVLWDVFPDATRLGGAGARGCAMLVGDDYVEAAGVPVEVADTVAGAKGAIPGR
jgi:hypothetical protein